MSQQPSVFVSHSHEDNEWCRQFVYALKDAGVDYWYDEESWKAAPLLEELERQQRQRPNFIAVLSRPATRSPYVNQEFTAAIGLRYRNPARDIVTVVAQHLDEDDIPLYWRDYRRICGPNNTPLLPQEAAQRLVELMFPQLAVKLPEQSPQRSSGSIFEYMVGVQHARRLPIYLLLDTSDAMRSDSIIHALNEGIVMIYRQLMTDPQSRESIYLSILTFPQQIYHAPVFIPIDQFVPPYLAAGGPSRLGEALHDLRESLDHDLISNTYGIRGDYKPLVFILLASSPEDDWRTEWLRIAQDGRIANVIGIAIGENADVSALRELASVVYRLEDMSPAMLRGFFQWISVSIIKTRHIGDPKQTPPVVPPVLKYDP